MSEISPQELCQIIGTKEAIIFKLQEAVNAARERVTALQQDVQKLQEEDRAL